MRPTQTTDRLARALEDYLLAGVLLVVALGAFSPALAFITDYSTTVLGGMVGGISLTITVGDVRTASRSGLAAIIEWFRG